MRAKLYGVGASLLFLVSLPVSVPYFTDGKVVLGAMTLAFGMLGACSLLALRFLGSLAIATHCLCLALWGALVSGYMVLGGVSSYNNKWLLVMPMLGAFSGSRRIGWVWLGVAALTPISFYLLIDTGVLTPQMVFDAEQLRVMDLVNSILFLVMCSFFIFIIHSHHVWVIGELRERKRVLSSNNEALMLARDEAVRANEARDQFLAKMSHEFRTPLNAIMGYSEMIQENLHDIELTEHDPDFERIQHAGNHLLGMLHDILDLTQFESSDVALPMSCVNVIAVLDEVTSRMPRPVIFDRASVPELLVTTHRQTFERLIQKVLDNACKFSEPSEQVGVRLYPGPESEQGIIVEIFDEGPGIAEHEQARIWEAFSQLDDSSTRVRDGAGLGLTLVRHFATSLELEVTLFSTPGQGTQVRVFVPKSIISD